MKKTAVFEMRISTICAVLFGILTTANAQVVWNAASGVDTNWSTGANWSTTASPGSSDNVGFNNTAAVASPATVNNVVDTDFTVAFLQYSNFVASGSPNYHVTQIADGHTLTVSGGLAVGVTNAGTGALVNDVITGANGNLTLSGGNFFVAQGSSGDGLHQATLDMSGLGTFTATVNRISIGTPAPSMGNGATRNAGGVYLARTNFITVSSTGTSNGIVINLNSNSGGGVGANKPSFLFLGQSNVLNADGIYVGNVKSSAGALFAFNPNGLNGPVAIFRGAAGGVSRISNWAVGSEQQISGSNQNGSGTNDFSGGTIDALVNNLVVGVTGGTSSGTPATSGNGTGLFNLGTGIMDVNNLTNGWSWGTGTVGDIGAGTINVKGGTLKVNNNLVLAINTSTGTGIPVGAVNVNGGTLIANNIIAGAGTSAINLTNAALIFSNAIGAGTIGTFAISNSILTLPAAGIGGTTISAGTVAVGGSTNVVNITSIPILANYPATLPIISYTTFNGVTNIGLGTLPAASPAFQGYITNDGSSGSINVVLTTGPALARALVWNGQINSTWDADNTANWHTNGGAATTYHDLDFVTFDDTAINHTVSLAQTLTPSDIIVSNNTTYTFNGGGTLAGSTALTKYGAGSLILDDSGSDTFSGGVTFSNCMVQVGNNDSGGSLGSGPVENDGALVFSRANNGLNVSNNIAGSGSVTNNGSGTVTLSGANSFDGNVTVNAGVLKANNNSALGSTVGSTTIASGASLDVSGRNLGQEQINVSGSGTDSGAANGAIFNSGAATSPALARVTLTANTYFGGSGRWDIRSANVNDANGASLSGAVNITKVGNNMIALGGVTVDPNLGNIDIQGGNFSVESATTGLGDPTKTLTVENNATLSLFNATNQFNKNITLNGNGINNLLGTVNNASGADTVAGAMTFNGNVEITFRSSAGAPTGGSLILSNAISGGGSLTKDNTNTLALAGPVKSYSGGTTINDGTFILNSISSDPNNVLTENATQTSSPVPVVVGGNGTNVGPVDIENILHPGASGHPSTFGVGSGTGNEYPGSDGALMFSANGGPAVAVFDLGSNASVVGGGVNDLITINGDLDGNIVPVEINPLGPLDTSTPYTLVTYTGVKNGGFAGASLLSGTSRYGFTLNYPAGAVTLSVSGGPALLEWNNNFGNGQWDVQSSHNWFNTGSSANDVFYNQDTVLLDDSIITAPNSLTTLTIPSGVAVSPQVITNSSTTNYTITGSGKITGATSLVKLGSSTLTLLNTNDFTGPATILEGSVAVSTAFAIGSAGSTVYVTNGGTFDLSPDLVNNGLNFGAKPFVVSGGGVGGNGAIINNGTNQQNAFQNVTLAGDTTFGGSARFDIRGGTPVLNTGGQAFNLTKKGANQINFVDATVDTNLANIDIQSGMFGLQGAVSSLGNPTNTLTIWSNVTFRVTDWVNTLVKTLVLSNGALVNNTSGTNSFGGPVTLAGTPTFILAGTYLTLTNVIGGLGGIIKEGGSPLNLTANETYTGNTTVSNGVFALIGSGAISSSTNIILLSAATLDVSARTNGALTLVSSQTLNGNGTVNGFVTANSGSIISFGTNGVVGRLTVTSNAMLNGTIAMKLNKTAGTNDVLTAGGSLAFGGTLSLTNLSGTLAANDQFKLFNARTYIGNFASIVPAHPNNDSSLNWDTGALNVNGILKVVSAVTPVPRITGISLSGMTVTITATNGNASGQFILLSSTNVALPLAQWTPVLTNTFDSNGNLNLSTNIINPNNGQQFYILSQ